MSAGAGPAALLHLALPNVPRSGTSWHTYCGRRVRLAGLAASRAAATCMSCRRATAATAPAAATEGAPTEARVAGVGRPGTLVP